MNQREKADFTQGSILNKLIPFMMPVLGALVLQAAYGAVDLLPSFQQVQVFPYLL